MDSRRVTSHYSADKFVVSSWLGGGVLSPTAFHSLGKWNPPGVNQSLKIKELQLVSNKTSSWGLRWRTIPYTMFPGRERSPHLQNLSLENYRILKNETREDLSG